MDAEFRLYREGKEEIKIESLTYDQSRIHLHIAREETLLAQDELSIAFRDGTVRNDEGAVLLFFSVEPVVNKVKGPLTLEYNVFDGGDMRRLENATVQVDTFAASTNINGQVFFHLQEGSYAYSAAKEKYTSIESSLELTDDTLVELVLFPTVADVKFRVLAASIPVSGAEVEIDKKKSSPTQWV